MKRTLLLLICIAITCPSAFSQGYLPLNLDTSCFWISNYHYYDGDIGWCRGEKVSEVIGDTIMSGNKYSIVRTYPTAYSYFNNYPCLPLFATRITYVREDTATKKVYDNYGNTVTDFGRQAGDTIFITAAGGAKVIVDSIHFKNVGGAVRRLQSGHLLIHSSIPYNYGYTTIEGIGVTYSFPVPQFGEWLIPSYSLKCFSRGGQTLYTDSPSITCVKSPPIKLEVKDAPLMNSEAFVIKGNSFKIVDATLLPLRVQLFDMTGRMLSSFVATSTAPITMDLVPGIYVLRLEKNKDYAAFKVAIE
jgi:hypothetical protein